MTYYLLKPCKGHAGYLSNMKEKTQVDLRTAIGLLESNGYEVMDVKHLLIAKKDIEVTVYPNGKLLVKTDDENTARLAAEAIYDIILSNREQ
jgi:ArsR family metal-binding transcriptional regulator